MFKFTRMTSKFSFLGLIQFRLVWTKLKVSSSNFILFISIIFPYLLTHSGITHKLVLSSMVTFGTSVWRFSETRTSTLGVSNLASSAMTLELFTFFLLKKIILQWTYSRSTNFKKKFNYFHISQFYTPTKKREFSTKKKKKKSKTKIITNRQAQIYIYY